MSVTITQVFKRKEINNFVILTLNFNTSPKQNFNEKFKTL